MDSKDPSHGHVHWKIIAEGSKPHDRGPICAQKVSDKTPIRPRAPTPLPPPPDSSSESDVSRSGEESSARGRLLGALDVIHGLVSHATSGRRAGPVSMDFTEEFLPSRFPEITVSDASFNPSTSILEPLPTMGVTTNMSEIVSQVTSVRSSVDLIRFAGHRDTFALLDLPWQSSPIPRLPMPVFAYLSQFFDFSTYLSLRLTCRSWFAGISYVRPLKLPAVYLVPAEILQQIYGHLSPFDFNAARRTCRMWMLSSLDYKLLKTMLDRGGWKRSMEADWALYWSSDRLHAPLDEIWLMSKRLATECSLCSDWTGNGLTNTSEIPSQSLPRFNGSSTEQTPVTGRSSMVLVLQTDFSDLSDGPQGSPINFTVSACGQFLLVATGCTFYLYSLSSPATSLFRVTDFPRPVTSIVDPRGSFLSGLDRREPQGSYQGRKPDDLSRYMYSHHRVMPLSDGYHLLYIDPVTNHLCLGGCSNLAKPPRQVMLLGPTNGNDRGELRTVTPEVYAVCGELKWGVRVVAGYGDIVWLFSIPPDIVNCRDGKGVEPWKNYYMDPGSPNAKTKNLGIIRIRGVKIGAIQGLMDVAINSFPTSFTIWAFGMDGMASTWQLGHGFGLLVRKKAMMRNGVVIDLVDGDGDILMPDAPPLPIINSKSVFSVSDQGGLRSSEMVKRLDDASVGAPDHVEQSVEDVHDTRDRDKDEGYWSNEEDAPGFGKFATHVPPLDGR